ncbi:MAG: hypothetical protein A2Z88_11570 [Omnitrophica WOR_2 bacterium GWA2_47_8]|nr:MAG: hypothetical protein A2Z88_11570 [Omnitrophica WOR_2 bacterium GWA2_47_8]
MGHKKILAIDDDQTIRALLGSRLKANFYDVSTAVDGLDGLEKYRSLRPDLIILDIDMPRMDGYTFVGELKNIPEVARPPIIMLTSKDGMQEVFRYEGVNDYIVKPFKMSELLEKIDKHLAVDHKKVLIIDDEAHFVELLQERLKLNGYNIMTALSGKEGLSIIQREDPDVVILDIMMPELNGYELCRLIKLDKKKKELAVIFVTAKTPQEAKKMADEAGADGCFSKPFPSEDLLQKMKELLWD